MKKQFYFTLVLILLTAVLLSSCTKKEPEKTESASIEETASEPASRPAFESEEARTEKSSEKEPESGEAAGNGTETADETQENPSREDESVPDDELSYEEDVRMNDVVPVFVQEHSPEDFDHFESDEKFFSPVSDDYLISSFESGKTMIYEFFHDGSLIAVRGRIVYDSEEELLAENPDIEMKADGFGKNTYTWHDNVLYYIMGQEALFASEMMMDKTRLLKTASQGLWDGYDYWFSKPYDDPLAEYDREKWTKVLDLLDRQIPEGVGIVYEDEPAEGEPGADGGGNIISEEEVRRLFEEKIEAAGRSADEYENSEVVFLLNKADLAYATLYCYTVPEDYSPGGKIENLTASGPILYNHDTESWEVSSLSDFMAEHEEEYYEALLSEDAYDAYSRGDIVKRFWIPFPKDKPVILPGIIVGRVLEIYETGDGGLAATVFFSNDTDEDVTVTVMESLKISDENGVVADVGADLGDYLPSGECFGETLLIPADFLREDYTSGLYVQEFLFTTEKN